MTSVNLATIRSTVRQRGDYAVSGKFTDAYLNIEIQAAWSETYELIADTNEGYWDTSGTVATVAGVEYVALPADCWRCSGIDLLDGGDWSELRQITIGERNRYGTAQGQPRAYRLSSRGAELYQTPGNIYTLRVMYVPIRTDLDEVTPRQFYGDWEEHTIAGALYRLAKREERSLQEPASELERQKMRVTGAASRRKQGEPELLVLRESFDAEEWF